MPFDPKNYSAGVAEILSSDVPPLEALRSLRPADLFPDGRAPEAAMSGLWLYFSCLDESHAISQGLPTPEGSFWHGILHRREPDAANARYWFRRVGDHSIFPSLAIAAEQALSKHPGARFHSNKNWDPMAFIDYWEDARTRPGSSDELLALAIQSAEWELLFDYCARPVGDGS